MLGIKTFLWLGHINHQKFWPILGVKIYSKFSIIFMSLLPTQANHQQYSVKNQQPSLRGPCCSFCIFQDEIFMHRICRKFILRLFVTWLPPLPTFIPGHTPTVTLTCSLYKPLTSAPSATCFQIPCLIGTHPFCLLSSWWTYAPFKLKLKY